MDRRELKRQAKEIKVEAGVYAIRNSQNGKRFVDSLTNMKRLNGVQFQLDMGSHLNKELQQEWNQFGAAAFTFEVLELLEVDEETAKSPYFDIRDELKKLKAKWLDELQPFGDRGYNTPKVER